MLTRRALPIAAGTLAAVTTLCSPAVAAVSDKLPSGAYAQLVTDILKAQSLSTGHGVTVAVVSTGVDPYDPGLSGKVTTGPDYAFSPAIPLAHEYGTSVASITAGRGPSGAQPLAALGVAPEARVLSIRAFPQPDEPGASGYDTKSSVSLLDARAIRYAVQHGAQVIYVEVGSSRPPAPALSSAVAFAVARKAVIVAPAYTGIADSAVPVFPPGMPGVIGVGSVQLSGGLAPFNKEGSVRNNSILIAGPGNTFVGSSGYGIDGPGAAAAIVAGTVALIKQLYPGITVPQVELALARSARYHPHGGYDITIGFGLVDPLAALREAATIVKSPVAGSAGVALSARLAPGQAPGTINAVRHPWLKVAGGAGAGAAGLLLIAAAVIVNRAGRRGKRSRNRGQRRRTAGTATP